MGVQKIRKLGKMSFLSVVFLVGQANAVEVYNFFTHKDNMTIPEDVAQKVGFEKLENITSGEQQEIPDNVAKIGSLYSGACYYSEVDPSGRALCVRLLSQKKDDISTQYLGAFRILLGVLSAPSTSRNPDLNFLKEVRHAVLFEEFKKAHLLKMIDDKNYKLPAELTKIIDAATISEIPEAENIKKFEGYIENANPSAQQSAGWGRGWGRTWGGASGWRSLPPSGGIHGKSLILVSERPFWGSTGSWGYTGAWSTSLWNDPYSAYGWTGNKNIPTMEVLIIKLSADELNSIAKKAPVLID